MLLTSKSMRELCAPKRKTVALGSHRHVATYHSTDRFLFTFTTATSTPSQSKSRSQMTVAWVRL
jgi:hypothetical protein